MRLIADTHVHFYPCYDLRQAFSNLRNCLSALDRNALIMGFLAERHDCHYFKELRENSGLLGNGITVRGDDTVLVISEQGYPDLYLFAGRQIITSERIEILALTTDMEIADGLPADDIISAVREKEGIPVVSWAPGKWFFRRKHVVASLIDSYEPGTLLFGDTTLRPVGWMEPFLMQRAVRKGFGLIAGSDPLPFGGEEKMMGRYAVLLESDFDPENPTVSIRTAFTRPEFSPKRIGKRGSVPETLSRLFKNARSKK